MPKRTKKNRYIKKGGVFFGTPAPAPPTPTDDAAVPAPAPPPQSTFSKLFSSVTGVATLAKNTAQKTADFAAQTAAETASFAANAAKKTANFAADAASSAADVAADAASNAADVAAHNNPAMNMANKIPAGGRRRRRIGGYGKSYKNLASPILTAKPQVWVGGKTRKITCNKRHKHTKSCKSKTNKKGNRKKRSRKSKFPFSESLKRLIKM